MRKYTIVLIVLITVIVVLGGCAGMTTPDANLAVGQLRVGNDRKAWEMIESDLQDPDVSTQLELCEMHGIAVQILQEVINKDYLPANKEEIGRNSYEYVKKNCQDFRRIVGITEHNYGWMLIGLGKPGEALPHIRASIPYKQKGSFDYILTLSTLADIYDYLGKYEQRDFYRQKALALAGAYFGRSHTYRWNTDEFNAWNSYAKILGKRLNELALGEHSDQNLEQMHHEWKILESIALRWSANETKYKVFARTSQLFAEAGDIAFAKKLYEQAEIYVSKYSRKEKVRAEADLKLNRAQIYKNEGDYSKAAVLIREWIDHYHSAYGSTPGANAYRIAGMICEEAGDYDRAIGYLEESIAGIETVRKSFPIEMRSSMIGGSVASTYWSLVRSYAKRYTLNGDKDDFIGALRAARMLRGRQFAELLGIDYHAGDPLDLSMLRLKPDELLINFLLTDRSIILFSITQDRYRLVEIPYEKQVFETMVGEFRQQLSQPGSNRYIQGATYLGKLLLSPVTDLLADAKRIIVIPDGVLNGIPVAVLSVSREQYKPLILKYETLRTPSLTFLIEERSNTALQKNKTLFALADPIYTGHALPSSYVDETDRSSTRAVNDLNLFTPLPETKIEVQRIAEYFPADSVRLVLGQEASESTVKHTPMQGYGYLHFATHGILGGQIPGIEEPALVLTAGPDSEDDGFLTMSEVSQLHLKSDLTVLSACDTGNGEYYTGEGVMGLSRAFLLAGSRSVVVSLWPVSSESTVSLMAYFYENLGSGKSKAQSLRLAQLRGMGEINNVQTGSRGLKRSGTVPHKTKMKTPKHPFYWAPFVLIGE